MSLYRKKEFWERVLGPLWTYTLFSAVLDTDGFESTMNILDSVYNSSNNTKVKTFPKKNNLFRAFQICPRDKLKLIIVGQDPYKNNKATGLAFANPKDTSDKDISPSLHIIMDALERSYPGEGALIDKTLESWAKQGVLFLNSSLSVSSNVYYNHKNLWKAFVNTVLNECTGNGECVVVLLGKEAQGFKESIHNWSTVLELPHPAKCNRDGMPLKLDFIKINLLLDKIYGTGISWINLFQEDFS